MRLWPRPKCCWCHLPINSKYGVNSETRVPSGIYHWTCFEAFVNESGLHTAINGPPPTKPQITVRGVEQKR